MVDQKWPHQIFTLKQRCLSVARELGREPPNHAADYLTYQ